MAVCYDKSYNEVDSIRYKKVICITKNDTALEKKTVDNSVTSSVGSSTLAHPFFTSSRGHISQKFILTNL